MENYGPHVEYTLIGAKLVGESRVGPTWASWRIFDKESNRHLFWAFIHLFGNLIFDIARLS